MPKEQGEVPEEEVTSETPEEETTQQEEAPTEKEQEASLKAQIQELQSQINQKDESYKGLQRSLNKTKEDLKTQSDTNLRLDGLEETLKILAAMNDERLASGEVDPEKKTDYLKQFESIQEKQKREREQAQLRRDQEDYNAKATELWKEAKELFQDDEDNFDAVEDLLMAGRYDRAVRKVERARTKNVKSEQSSEKSPQIPEDELEEFRAWKKGLTKPETLQSSGKTKTNEQVLEDYIAGRVGHEEYAKVRNKVSPKGELFNLPNK